MWRPGRDVFFVLALLLWTLLPGCIEPAYLPALAVPVVAGILVQQNDRKNPPPTTSTTTTTAPVPTPTALPIACPPPLGTARQVTCADFACRERAQEFFVALLNAGLGDCHNLDAENPDGRVCLILPQCRADQ